VVDHKQSPSPPVIATIARRPSDRRGSGSQPPSSSLSGRSLSPVPSEETHREDAGSRGFRRGSNSSEGSVSGHPPSRRGSPLARRLSSRNATREDEDEEEEEEEEPRRRNLALPSPRGSLPSASQGRSKSRLQPRKSLQFPRQSSSLDRLHGRSRSQEVVRAIRASGRRGRSLERTTSNTGGALVRCTYSNPQLLPRSVASARPPMPPKATSDFQVTRGTSLDRKPSRIRLFAWAGALRDRKAKARTGDTGGKPSAPMAGAQPLIAPGTALDARPVDAPRPVADRGKVETEEEDPLSWEVPTPSLQVSLGSTEPSISAFGKASASVAAGSLAPGAAKLPRPAAPGEATSRNAAAKVSMASTEMSDHPFGTPRSARTPHAHFLDEEEEEEDDDFGDGEDVCVVHDNDGVGKALGEEDEDLADADDELRLQEERDKALVVIRRHLNTFLHESPSATYDRWLRELHPENARQDELDLRFFLPDSDHRVIWNSHPSVIEQDHQVEPSFTEILRAAMGDLHDFMGAAASEEGQEEVEEDEREVLHSLAVKFFGLDENFEVKKYGRGPRDDPLKQSAHMTNAFQCMADLKDILAKSGLLEDLEKQLSLELDGDKFREVSISSERSTSEKALARALDAATSSAAGSTTFSQTLAQAGKEKIKGGGGKARRGALHKRRSTKLGKAGFGGPAPRSPTSADTAETYGFSPATSPPRAQGKTMPGSEPPSRRTSSSSGRKGAVTLSFLDDVETRVFRRVPTLSGEATAEEEKEGDADLSAGGAGTVSHATLGKKASALSLLEGMDTSHFRPAPAASGEKEEDERHTSEGWGPMGEPSRDEERARHLVQVVDAPGPSATATSRGESQRRQQLARHKSRERMSTGMPIMPPRRQSHQPSEPNQS